MEPISNNLLFSLFEGPSHSHSELEKRIEEVVDRYLPHNHLADRVIHWHKEKQKMIQELYELIQHSSKRTSPLLIDMYSYDSHSSTSSSLSLCSMRHSTTLLSDEHEAVQSSLVDTSAETVDETKIVYLQSMESIDDLFLAKSSTEADSCVVLCQETVKSFLKDQLHEWLGMVRVSSAKRRSALDNRMNILLRGLAHAYSVSLKHVSEKPWSSTLYSWVAETILSFADRDDMDGSNKTELRPAKRLLISVVQVASKLVEEPLYNLGIWELYSYCNNPSHSVWRKEWVLSLACSILKRGLDSHHSNWHPEEARSQPPTNASTSSGKPADNRRANY